MAAGFCALVGWGVVLRSHNKIIPGHLTLEVVCSVVVQTLQIPYLDSWHSHIREIRDLIIFTGIHTNKSRIIRISQITRMLSNIVAVFGAIQFDRLVDSP
jgi:hypothetical protein